MVVDLNQMQFHAEQTFKMHSFRQEGWKLQLLHIQYIDFIPHCSVLKKVVRGKTRGAAAKNRWTLPLKICIYPGMKKGCLRSIETSGDAMDDQMHMLRIH